MQHVLVNLKNTSTETYSSAIQISRWAVSASFSFEFLKFPTGIPVELWPPRPDGVEEGLRVGLEELEERHLVDVRLQAEALVVAGGEVGRHGLQLLQPSRKFNKAGCQ